MLPSMSGSHPPEERLVWTLPLPLARLWRRAANAKSAIERHQAAYYLWETALKLLGSLAVVEYLALGQRAADLDERLRNLSRPALGHWWELVRRLLPILADSTAVGGRFQPVRDVLLGRARDDFPRAAGLDAALREALDGSAGARTTVRLGELFERLIRHRNQELGHGAAGQRSRQFYERMGSAIFAGASEILGKLDVLAGGRLTYIGEVRRQASGEWLIERYELSGESPRRLESLELGETDVSRTDDLPRPGRVYVDGVASIQQGLPLAGLRSLHPLVLFDADAGEMFFLNSRRGEDRAQYLSYSSGQVVDREDLGADQREFFATIAGEAVSRETVRSWAARSQAEESGVSPAGVSPEQATPRRTMGEFELLSRLGRGGMGVVYRAWQPSLGREVALKCVIGAGDPRIEARFAREIRSLGRVEHPNLVKVFTSGSDGDQWFYAMELIEGADLASVSDRLSGTSASEVGEDEWQRAVSTACAEARRREEVLSPSPEHDRQRSAPVEPARDARPALRPGRAHIEHAVDLVRQAAQAAHALHEAGVIHRDIKPGNIVVSDGGKHAVLMDLGLAQLADDADGRLTRTRQFVGTLRYASPEQVLAAGNLDRRADIYSLGATLWELLTLRSLFGASEQTPTPDLMLRIQSAEPERPRRLNPQVPSDLEAIVLKCLEKDRARRYETAAGLAEDLARWQRGEPVEARAPTLGYVLGKYARRHRLGIGTAAAILAVAVAGVIAAFIHIDRVRDVAEEQHSKAVLARKETETALFDTYTSFGLKAGDDGNPAQALLWFANAGFLARDDAERQASNRVRLRSWGRKAAVPVLALTHPGWDVLEIAFHPAGAHLLVLAGENRSAVWDLATEERLSWMGGDRPVSAAAFSPGGDRLATGGPGGEVEMWSFPDGKKLSSWSHAGPVARLAFSPDGRRLAVASDRVRVWDVYGEDPAPVTPELPHPKPVARLVFNSRGDRLATGCRDGKARVHAVPGDPSKPEPLFPPVTHLRTTYFLERSLEPVFIDEDRNFSIRIEFQEFRTALLPLGEIHKDALVFQALFHQGHFHLHSERTIRIVVQFDHSRSPMGHTLVTGPQHTQKPPVV
jgi:serine/threonine protein kinase